MTKRFRLTGFARFLFVMVILVPAAYIGASYYNGEDGIQNIKNLLGIQSTNAVTTHAQKRNSDKEESNLSVTKIALEQRISDLEAENRDLEAEIREMKVQIRDLKLELKTAQLQLKNAKSNNR